MRVGGGVSLQTGARRPGPTGLDLRSPRSLAGCVLTDVSVPAHLRSAILGLEDKQLIGEGARETPAGTQGSDASGNKHRGLFWACQRPFQETANPGPEPSKQQRPHFQTLA